MASSQLARMVASSGAFGNFRWPYHAIAMNVFDPINSRTVRMEGSRVPSAAKRHSVLRAACGRAAGEEVDQGPVERGQVGGLPAAHPVAVLDHLPVHPAAARVTDVVLEGVVA